MAQAAANKCNMCNENIGSVFCYECQKTLCKSCRLFHDKIPATKRHTVTDSQSVDRLAFKSSLTCQQHDQEYVHYCQYCKCLTCLLCATTDHKGHSFTGIADVAAKGRIEINESISEIKTRLSRLSESINEIKTTKQPQIQSDCDKFTSDVRKTSKEFHQIIDSVTEINLTRATDFLEIEQQQQDDGLTKLENSLKERQTLNEKLERLLQEKHDMTFFLNYDSLASDVLKLYDEELPHITEPKRLGEFKQEDYTTLVAEKIHSEFGIRILNEKVDESSKLKEQLENMKFQMDRANGEKDSKINDLQTKVECLTNQLVDAKKKVELYESSLKEIDQLKYQLETAKFETEQAEDSKRTETDYLKQQIEHLTNQLMGTRQTVEVDYTGFNPSGAIQYSQSMPYLHQNSGTTTTYRVFRQNYSYNNK